MTAIRLSLIFILLAANTAVASASLGGVAARGDNCTPFNSYKIGYAVPGGTITMQSIVLAEGWRVAGWILHTASGRLYYVPNPQYFDRAVNDNFYLAGPPVLTIMRALSPAALDKAYRIDRSSRREYTPHIDRDSPTVLPAKTLVAPCYLRALEI